MFRSGVRRFGTAAAVLVTCAALAACGSDTSGHATAAEMDVRELDVGPYPTLPLDLRYTYQHSLVPGKVLASTRLAEKIARGQEIDQHLKYQTGFQEIYSDDSLTQVLANANGPVAQRNGMMFGVASASSDTQNPTDNTQKYTSSSDLRLAVMQFPSEEAAARAAQEFEQTDFAIAPDQNQPVTIPGYPAAHSHRRPGVATLGSTMAHGQYVIDVYAVLPTPDLPALTELVAKTYAAQIPFLDSAPPLSPEDVVRLPPDPDGMLNRTLNTDGIGTPEADKLASYGPRGYRLQVADQELWKKRMNDSGLDRFSFKKEYSNGTARVFRTRDHDGAAKLSSTVLDDSYPSPAEAPPDIPDARCGETKSGDWQVKRFSCEVSYRRYVATVEGDQIQDVHQRAAAQYALLANNQ